MQCDIRFYFAGGKVELKINRPYEMHSWLISAAVLGQILKRLGTCTLRVVNNALVIRSVSNLIHVGNFKGCTSVIFFKWPDLFQHLRSVAE